MSLQLPHKIIGGIDYNKIREPWFLSKILREKGFSVSHRFEGVGDGDPADLYLSNPSDSGKYVFLVVVRAVSQGKAYVDLYHGVTVTTAGTSLTPVNLFRGSTASSVVSAEYGGTYDISGATHILSDLCPGGYGVKPLGDAIEVGESAVIPPGLDLLVRVTNVSGMAQDIAIKVSWWEDELKAATVSP